MEGFSIRQMKQFAMAAVAENAVALDPDNGVIQGQLEQIEKLSAEKVV